MVKRRVQWGRKMIACAGREKKVKQVGFLLVVEKANVGTTGAKGTQQKEGRRKRKRRPVYSHNVECISSGSTFEKENQERYMQRGGRINEDRHNLLDGVPWEKMLIAPVDGGGGNWIKTERKCGRLANIKVDRTRGNRGR